MIIITCMITMHWPPATNSRRRYSLDPPGSLITCDQENESLWDS